jgi:diacylglycerol O-acyltransferase
VEHLTPLDDMFVVLERDNLPMHIGGLLIFEGPAPTYREFVEFLDGRLDRIPRYRQVISRVPLNLGPPAWLDDQHFHLPYHVRHTALPQPGTDAQLRTLTGRILSLRLDLERSPWETWLIEGLTDGRFAVVNKVHHAMVDGLSGADLMEVLLDPNPQRPTVEASAWEPQPWPSAASRVTASIGAGVRQPIKRLQHIGASVEAPMRALRSVAATAVGTVRLGQKMAHTENHLLGQPGPHRRWVWAEGDLWQVKVIKNAFGGTVNDVILTAIAGGFRTFLLGREAELAPQDCIRTMVPVSTRQPDAPKGGNEVAALFVDLPVGIADPVQRLQAMRERMVDVKTSGLLQGTDSLVANAVFIPPALFAAGGRLAAVAPQPMVATITTNVPGPQYPLYLLGRELLRMLPYVPLGMNQLITVAILSYNGHLNCGITADYDKVPDVGLVVDGIEDTLAALAEAAAEQ